MYMKAPEVSAAFNMLNCICQNVYYSLLAAPFITLGASLEVLNFNLHHIHSSFTVPIFLLSPGNTASGFLINMAVAILAFLYRLV